MQINDNIKKARELKGYSQAKIAELLGEKRSTYAEWERSTVPRADILAKISQITGVSMPELLDEISSNHGQQKPSNRLTGANVTLQDYIDLLKKNNEKAEQEKDKILSALERISKMYLALSHIKANSDATISKLDAIEDQVRSEHAAEMDSLDRLEKNPIGTNAIKAGNLEIDRKKKRREKGRSADADK